MVAAKLKSDLTSSDPVGGAVWQWNVPARAASMPSTDWGDKLSSRGCEWKMWRRAAEQVGMRSERDVTKDNGTVSVINSLTPSKRQQIDA